MTTNLVPCSACNSPALFSVGEDGDNHVCCSNEACPAEWHVYDADPLAACLRWNNHHAGLCPIAVDDLGGFLSKTADSIPCCPFCGCDIGILFLGGLFQWHGKHKSLCVLAENPSAGYGRLSSMIEEWSKRADAPH